MDRVGQQLPEAGPNGFVHWRVAFLHPKTGEWEEGEADNDAPGYPAIVGVYRAAGRKKRHLVRTSDTVRLFR